MWLLFYLYHFHFTIGLTGNGIIYKSTQSISSDLRTVHTETMKAQQSLRRKILADTKKIKQET